MATGTRFDGVRDGHLPSGTKAKESNPEQAETASRRHPFRTGFILGAAVTVAMTLLIIQNGETVKFEWSILDLEWPLWVILLVSFVSGMVAWQLFLHEIRRIQKAAIRRRTVSGKTNRISRMPRTRA